MTKDTAEFSQAASQPKGWIQWNTKIGPVLEVATSHLHGEHGIDVRIMF